jgi:hypothetical protein
MDVKLVVAQTGRILASKRLVGADPRECGDTEFLDTISEGLDGRAISSQDVMDWMEQVLGFEID